MRTTITMNSNNILFYSPRCPFCQKCLELIEPHQEKINFIGYINIHSSRDELPLRIRRVPTLVINDGETIYEGKDVYLWISRLINIINTQQEPTGKLKEIPQEKEVVNTNTVNSSLQTVWSSSTLVRPDSVTYASIQNNKTLTEMIDYSKIKPIELNEEKITISPESIQDRRNNELEKIRPTSVNNAFFQNK